MKKLIMNENVGGGGTPSSLSRKSGSQEVKKASFLPFAKQTEACHSELVSESQNLTGNRPLTLALSLKGRGDNSYAKQTVKDFSPFTSHFSRKRYAFTLAENLLFPRPLREREQLCEHSELQMRVRGQNKKVAFTLAEMMVVLLIMTIILAAMAPVMTTRMSANKVSGGGNTASSEIWKYVEDSGETDIYYGTTDNQRAMIGQNKAETAENARLILNTSDDIPNHLMFKNGDTNLGGLRFETNNSMLLGSLKADSTLGDYGIAIGKNINIVKHNSGGRSSIAIGTSTEVYEKSFDGASIAIGHSSKAAESAVAINGTASGTFALAINGVASDQGGIAIGPKYSPYAKTTCVWGIAIGQGAEGCGIAIGSAATDNGQYGIVIGSLAKVNNGSIAIGRYAESMALSAIAFGGSTQATADYSVAIGYKAKATTANTIVLGTASETVQIPGSLTVATTSYPSDRKLKNIGEEYTSSLDKIKQLKPFNFTYKNDKNKTPRVGVIAQDLKKVFPNAVSKGKDGFLTIRLEDMFYAVINAIKELDAKLVALTQIIKQVQDDNVQLKKENLELKKRIEFLEQRIK